MRILCLLALFLAVSAEKKEETPADLTGGYPSEIDWVEWDKAVGVAKDLNKPIFFLIHKTWCGACSALKREFKSSTNTADLIELSKKFVMVNVEDDAEPEDDKYAPDGGYIPRILFLDTDSNPLSTNNEKKYKNNKYFYPLVPQIIDAMNRALEEFEAPLKMEEPLAPEVDAKAEKETKTKEDASSEEEEEEKTKKIKEKKDSKEKSEKSKDKKETEKKQKKEKSDDKEEKEKDDKKKKEKKEKKDKTEDKKKDKGEKKKEKSKDSKKEESKKKEKDSKKSKKEEKDEL